MINISIEFDNQSLNIPVNPENILVKNGLSSEKVSIVGLGNIIIPGDEELSSFSIESFFPSPNSEFYTGVSPKSCVDFIKRIRSSTKVCKIVTEGLPVNINMYSIISEFDYDSRAGEEEDIYYTLDIIKYIPYGARFVNMQGTSNNAVISGLNRVNNKPLINQVYEVKAGDTITSITKKITGDTNRWRELYNENTAAIGNSVDYIYEGQKLVLPESWVIT